MAVRHKGAGPAIGKGNIWSSPDTADNTAKAQGRSGGVLIGTSLTPDHIRAAKLESLMLERNQPNSAASKHKMSSNLPRFLDDVDAMR